jgi:hypothetical protein
MARHAHSEFRESDNLLAMIREKRVAERIAVAAYQEKGTILRKRRSDVAEARRRDSGDGGRARG